MSQFRPQYEATIPTPQCRGYQGHHEDDGHQHKTLKGSGQYHHYSDAWLAMRRSDTRSRAGTTEAPIVLEKALTGYVQLIAKVLCPTTCAIRDGLSSLLCEGERDPERAAF